MSFRRTIQLPNAPNPSLPLQSGLPEFEGGVSINVIAGVDPGYLNAGLMKPPKEFTLVAGKEKTGGGQVFRAD